jgi:N-acetylneuraminate synthase
MQYHNMVEINGREISISAPSYFIADIASNHDGDLERAKALIWLAKEAGADAVKFQHFKADKIVSDFGFRNLGQLLGHQGKWQKPVYEIYKQYECNRDWNDVLIETARAAKVDFLTTPYDFEAVEMLDQYLPAYKIGSGDITWIDFVRYVADRQKPVLLATGASCMEDVERAVSAVLDVNRKIVLLQCNTNYTGSIENLRHVNLRVLHTYAIRYPNMVLGLSDHTPGHATVLGAVAIGARVIEKHFTDDNDRTGPDHAFSMNPGSWHEMVERCRELEAALGNGIKRIEENETETVVLQRRCLRLAREKQVGEVLGQEDLEVLRPSPAGALQPYDLATVLNRKLKGAKRAGDALFPGDLEGM